MILRLLPQLSQSEWTKRCSQLYRTDSVLGPEAVAWGLEMMAMIHPPGKDRVTILEQMDKAKDDAAIMKQIRKGWQAFGVDDPWWVVHDKPVRQMARYNSEPSGTYMASLFSMGYWDTDFKQEYGKAKRPLQLLHAHPRNASVV